MKTIHLPKEFERITVDQLLPGDIIVYYYGNKITKLHGEKLQKKKYGRVIPCPYHTNIVYDKTMRRKRIILLDTELRTTLSFLEFEYMVKTGIRIDVIRYSLNEKQTNIIMDMIEKVGGKEPLYGVRKFAGFLKRVRFLGWIGRLIEPRNISEQVCSTRVAHCHMKANNTISLHNWNNSIPGDFIYYGVYSKRPELYTIKVRGEKIG